MDTFVIIQSAAMKSIGAMLDVQVTISAKMEVVRFVQLYAIHVGVTDAMKMMNGRQE